MKTIFANHKNMLTLPCKTITNGERLPKRVLQASIPDRRKHHPPHPRGRNLADLKHGYHLHMDTHSAGVGYESNTSSRISIGRVGVSLSYRFGKQVQVKRTKSTINNDDFERTEQGGDDTPRM